MKDDDLPWEAEVLSAGPLKINDKTRDEDLVAALDKRLDALLSIYDIQPTPDGWRQLALELLAYQSAQKSSWIEVRTPYNRGSNPGARFKDYQNIIHRMKKLMAENPGIKPTVAAQILHKERKKEGIYEPITKSLYRIWKNETETPRGNIPEFYWAMKVRDAFEQAAVRLETKFQSQKSTQY